MNQEIHLNNTNFSAYNKTAASAFHITTEEETELRQLGSELVPSPVIFNSKSFHDFVTQLMIPHTAIELARKCADIKLSKCEIEGIRRSLKDGRLRDILDDKFEEDPSHPPYIRVDCTNGGAHVYGSPVVLEIWPGQHYSPIHSHGKTTGIIYCLTGQLDVMLYDHLDWNAKNWGYSL